jgi:hypothetical protein
MRIARLIITGKRAFFHHGFMKTYRKPYPSDMSDEE